MKVRWCAGRVSTKKLLQLSSHLLVHMATGNEDGLLGMDQVCRQTCKKKVVCLHLSLDSLFFKCPFIFIFLVGSFIEKRSRQWRRWSCREVESTPFLFFTNHHTQSQGRHACMRNDDNLRVSGDDDEDDNNKVVKCTTSTLSSGGGRPSQERLLETKNITDHAHYLQFLQDVASWLNKLTKKKRNVNSRWFQANKIHFQSCPNNFFSLFAMHNFFCDICPCFIRRTA